MQIYAITFGHKNSNCFIFFLAILKVLIKFKIVNIQTEKNALCKYNLKYLYSNSIKMDNFNSDNFHAGIAVKLGGIKSHTFKVYI